MSPLPDDSPGLASRRAWNYVRLGKAGRQCHYCDTSFSLEVPPTRDHKDPKATGTTLDDNVVLACGECNSAKGMASYEEYMAATQQAWNDAGWSPSRYQRPVFQDSGDGIYRLVK